MKGRGGNRRGDNRELDRPGSVAVTFRHHALPSDLAP
jgi:hypothetical protein